MLKARTPKLFYLLIALACMNFLGRGSIVFLLLCCYELFRRKGHIALDKNAIAVGLFSLCVFFASAIYYSYAECIKAANYFFLYLLGYDSLRRAKDKDKCIESTALAICIGFGAELILMYLYNRGREQISARSMYSIWTEESISVTLLGLLVSAVIGFSFYAFFYSKQKLLKIGVAIMLAIGLAISIDTATRTPIILLFVVYAAMFFIQLFNTRGIKAFKSLLLSIVLIGILFAVYQIDIGGIQSILQQTPLFQRLLSKGLQTSRWEISQKFFSFMLLYPWGGKHIEQTTGILAHNYLQECFDLYGVFAFVMLLVITLQFISIFFKFAFKKRKNGTDMLFLSLYMSILLQMCVEPVFSGYPILIWSLLLIHGMATAYFKTSHHPDYCIT